MFDFIEVEEQIAELSHQFGEKVFDVLGKAFKEIDNTIGKDNLHGFAIATDDYITSLFGMACSTDPCVPTERLLLESIDRLNSKQVSDVAAKDLGVEKYRKL